MCRMRLEVCLHDRCSERLPVRIQDHFRFPPCCCISSVTILSSTLVISNPSEGFFYNVTMLIVLVDEATHLQMFFILFYFILVEIENISCWKLNRLDFVRWERSRGYRDDVLSCYDKERKKKANYLF